ncbi:MAG: TolC family protein [Gammaproteobacteria bacterium]
MRATLLGVGSVLISATSGAQMPEPFTLADAFKLADGQHPSERVSQAAVSLAEAERLGVDAGSGVKADLNAMLRAVDPNDISSNQEHNDSQASLVVSKRLYDFGQTAALEAGADAAIQASRLQLIAERNNRAIEVLRRYLDVVEADLNAAAATENMTMRFLNADRARERAEMQRDSDLRVAELDADFQRERVDFVAAEALQRSSRARLSNALNRPTEVASTVVAPNFPGNQRKLPELAGLLETALKNNPELASLDASVTKARQALAASEKSGSPVLSGQLEANHWERDLGGRDYWRGSLMLKVPLFTGGSVDAAVAKAAAQLASAEAKRDAAALRIRQEVLEAYEGVGIGKAKVQRAEVELAYRELDLDRARGEYQLEFKADLGDAMVRFSNARLINARAHHDLAMAWARLDSLRGEPVQERVLGIGLPPEKAEGSQAEQ